MIKIFMKMMIIFNMDFSDIISQLYWLCLPPCAFVSSICLPSLVAESMAEE